MPDTRGARLPYALGSALILGLALAVAAPATALGQSGAARPAPSDPPATGPEIDGPPPPAPPAVVARDASGNVTLQAVRLDAPLQLDGRLDEAVYRTVPAITDFVQQEPNTGEPATQPTEAWVMFDDDTLYIAARCRFSEPGRIVANEMKRDSPGMFGNDSFAVVLDTFYDRRNGYIFITNPLGGLFDATVTNERGCPARC